MRRKHLDLSIALLIAAINVGWVFLPDRPLIGTVLCGLPLIFIVPGYTLTEALFVLKPTDGSARTTILRPFGNADRIILSLGLSLSLVIINGLLLNILPLGLARPSWVISLAVLSTLFSLIALYRRRGTSTGLPQQAAPRLFRFTFYDTLLFLLALVTIVAAFQYTWLTAQQQQQQMTFTQFWMVQSKQVNHTCTVLVGIQSFEASTANYKVILTANEVPLYTWSPVTLAPKQQWLESVNINPGDAESGASIDAQLYRLDRPGIIYREAHLALNSSGGSAGGKLVC